MRASLAFGFWRYDRFRTAPPRSAQVEIHPLSLITSVRSSRGNVRCPAVPRWH